MLALQVVGASAVSVYQGSIFKADPKLIALVLYTVAARMERLTLSMNLKEHTSLEVAVAALKDSLILIDPSQDELFIDGDHFCFIQRRYDPITRPTRENQRPAPVTKPYTNKSRGRALPLPLSFGHNAPLPDHPSCAGLKFAAYP
jgi:hypothetical protein